MINVDKYVERNQPSLFPSVKKIFNAYITCLLKSANLTEVLKTITAYFDPALDPSEPGKEQLFFPLRELHPLAQSFTESRYLTILAYSRLFKDDVLFNMIGMEFFGVTFEKRFGQSLVGDVITNLDVFEDDQTPVANPGSSMLKTVDRHYALDMVNSAGMILLYSLPFSKDIMIDAPSYNDILISIGKVRELMLLVVPARTPVIFNPVPYFYVGRGYSGFVKFRFKVEDDLLQVNDGVDDGVDTDAGFRLNNGFLEHEEPPVLPLEIVGDELVLVTPDVIDVSNSLNGLLIVLSPFNSAEQMQAIHNYIEGGGTLGGLGLYGGVLSTALNLTVSFVVKSPYELIIRVEAMNQIEDLTILPVVSPGGVVLSDIKLEFDWSKIERYLSNDVPLYSIQLLVDFL